jgi:seryl-tRNA synthetase
MWESLHYFLNDIPYFKPGINVDPASRSLKAERDQLTLRRTTISAELKQARASGRAADSLTAESHQIRDRLTETKAELCRLEETRLLEALRLPNVAAAAPATDRIVHQVSSAAKAQFPLRTHQQLMVDNHLGEFSSNR